ncbi:OmpA family protein [Scandinavium goeteborgense]|uniref:Outer membrane protein OmpA-like peptidoglycan-associated protein n=1 Tax=Scandinavium goeteborgense TaxID=1851514 RepID=A0A4V3BLQ0_SCAGO|nr:OmpA family protein [Scandinavium goeteborgense]TDN47452.1 outer membrane protein OmpA-like peptidoglycan-associated protein [Scandinavium goeteborgense]
MNREDGFSKGVIDLEFLEVVSKFLGEREEDVNLALSGIVPLLFDKIKAHLTWAKEPVKFLDLLRESPDINTENTSASSLLEQTHSGSATGKMLSMLMPHQTDSLVNMVSNVSGVSNESGRSLVSVGAALLFSTLRNYLRQRKAQSLSLKGWMDSIDYDAVAMLPAPFKNYLQKNNVESYIFPEPRPGTAVGRADEGQKNKCGFKWLWLLLLAAIVALILLLKGCISTGESDRTAMQKTTDSVRALWGNLGAFFSKVLPDGKTINIPQKGMENQLINYIETDKSDPNVTFAFDRLLFMKNSSDLDPASKDQLSNIVAILKAWPNVYLQLNGYTDTSGTDEFNMKLSQDRANAVRQALIDQGASESHLEAVGFGSANPVAANDTEANRAKNRRIEIQVSRK